MGFSNNRLLFVLNGKGFSTVNSGTEEPSTLHHEQTISGEEMHTLITFMLSVMASNIQWMAYKLIYNPLIDYIRSHVRFVRLVRLLLYSTPRVSKASNFML